MNHRGTEYDFGLLAQQSVVALGGVLEALAVCVLLAADGNVLQYLAIEHFHVLVADHQAVESVVGYGVECGVFQCLHDEPAWFLPQEALDAEDDAAFVGEVLGDVFLVLIIVLSDHSLVHEVEGATDFSFLQDGVSLLELHWNEDAGERLDAEWREWAIESGYFPGYVASSVHLL